MTEVLVTVACLAALIAALCVADALAGVVMRSRRFAAWWEWWSGTAEHTEFRTLAAKATTPRSLP